MNKAAQMTPGGPERTCRQVKVTPDGIDFMSCKDTPYTSLNCHRAESGTQHPKSIWAIAVQEECHRFCEAEIFDWSDSDGNYWSISKDGEIELGTRGERLAYFNAPQNERDPWHGYPVGGRRGLPTVRRPPKAIIERWWQTGWIKYVTYSRLMGGRL
jgi:hypothetical protein